MAGGSVESTIKNDSPEESEREVKPKRYDFVSVFTDLFEALNMTSVWSSLAFMEIRRRYKRTLLGPFWATASLGFFTMTLGFLYAHLWNIEPAEYLPYLTSGMICWMLFSSILIEGAAAFISAEGVIKQTKLPFFMFLFTAVLRNLIVFAHHILIFVCIAFYYSVNIGWNTLLVIPGLILFLLLCGSAGLVLALACSRFRDIQQVLTSILQVALFITPVLYKPDLLQGRAGFIADVNPIFHAINLIRYPMLGQAPSALSWTVSIGLTIFLTILGLSMFARLKRYLVHWI